MNNMIKGKKAEMNTAMVIGAAILIFSFLIILFIWYRANPTGEIDKAVCHQSIVERSTFNVRFIEVGKSIPLRCKTEKVCLKSSNENCEASGFGNPSKTNPVIEIKVSDTGLSPKDAVLDTIADKMYECHDTLGRGLLDFMKHSTLERNYCLICSRIALEEKARENTGESINYGELYKYLQNKKDPTGKSYLEFIYPNWQNWEASKALFEELKTQSTDKKFKELKFEDWKINLNNENGYAIIAQMAPASTWRQQVSSGLIAVGTGLTATGIGAPLGVALIGGGVAGGAAIWYSFPNEKYVYSPPTLYPYDEKTLNSLNCYSFETAP